MAARLLPIDCDALLVALTTRDEGLVGTYLDLQTGALLRVYDPAIVGRNNDDAELQFDAEPERFAKVPLYSREYRLMTEFVDTVEDDDLARLLDAALGGRSAFRRFDTMLAGWPTERIRWEQYRREALLRWALGWLRSHGVDPGWEEDGSGLAARPVLLELLLAHGQMREVTAATEPEAQALFIRLCRELCELGQEPFRARPLRSATRFLYEGVEVRRDGVRVRVVQLP